MQLSLLERPLPSPACLVIFSDSESASEVVVCRLGICHSRSVTLPCSSQCQTSWQWCVDPEKPILSWHLAEHVLSLVKQVAGLSQEGLSGCLATATDFSNSGTKCYMAWSLLAISIKMSMTSCLSTGLLRHSCGVGVFFGEGRLLAAAFLALFLGDTGCVPP